MQWTDRIKQVKMLLVAVAVLLVAASLLVSNILVRDLSKEEHNRMDVWAEAMRSLNSADENTDLALVLKVLNGNNTIPVVVLDKAGEVQTYRNIMLDVESAEDSVAMVLERVADMRDAGRCIRIDLEGDTVTGAGADYMEIYYDESIMLKRLATYPYVQLGVVLVFVMVAIFALLSSRKAEQNKVWVGLSKETAHQLGTPISSLMAWVEILRESYPDDTMIPEMNKDVKRLEMIAERFSKIGSRPDAQPENMNEVIYRVMDYISRRVSNNVKIECQLPEQPLILQMSAPLFEWVVENLCKNAIDAMDGRGRITLKAFEETERYVLEVDDTGKGIAKKNFGSVFAPGYTTKKRGWGLGLSLAKRIIEEYHKGKIFVKSSEIGKGTTFRIELKKN